MSNLTEKGEDNDDDDHDHDNIDIDQIDNVQSNEVIQSNGEEKERVGKKRKNIQFVCFVATVFIGLALAVKEYANERKKTSSKKKKKKKREKSDHCAAFIEVCDIKCYPPPTKEIVRKLANTKFVLKDMFEVRDRRRGVGFGSPQWESSHATNSDKNNAEIVETLFRNGASLVGITHMDELAYSIDGQNEHFGTPINPSCETRIPGGSSSGSAVAVAARLRDCDFGIGTDSAGSVRVPAAYCGVYGFRPSHGMVSTKGCQNFAKTFDTVGWFAKGSKVLKDVGDVLLKEADDEKYGVKEPKQFAILTDLMHLADAQGSAAVASALKAFGYDDKYAGKVSKLDLGERLKMLCPSLRTDVSGKTGLELIRDKMHLTMGFEIYDELKDWLETTKPTLGKQTAMRIENAKKVSEQDYENLTKLREEIREVMDQIMDGGTVFIFPTVPGVAPLREGRSDEEILSWRMKTFQFLAIASFCGLPQVAIPLNYPNSEGPCSVSLMGGFQTDKMLLDCAFRYSGQMQEYFPNYVITEIMKMDPPKLPGDEEKVKGNQAYAAGKYDQAIHWYTKALEKKTLPVYLANRALVYLKMGQMEDVEKDCTEALKLDNKYVKAYLRRAKARMILGSFLEAALDYEEALKLEPSNREARDEMKNMQKHLEPGASDAMMPTNSDVEIARTYI